MRNNHIVFGICFADKLHPVEWWERCIALLGSIAFGLAATTYAQLWDQYDPELMERNVVAINDYAITTGMIMLWTFGSLGHGIFDFLSWHIMACACFHPGGRHADWYLAHRCKDLGSYLMIPIVLALGALAGILVVIRASRRDSQADGTYTDDLAYTDIDGHWRRVDGLQSFSFMADYAIELGLAWLVYFPVVGTIMFSGILGCRGTIPVLGGRPRDKWLFEEGKIGSFKTTHDKSSHYSAMRV